MNHTPLLLIFAVLITVISIPVYGEVITDHVVINEVDTNPFGDDSKSVSEWVELYNPTNFDIDLSGWEIASTTVLKKTFIIPDGTVISSGDFLTFTHEKLWFTDSNESVELRTDGGSLIDKTPVISDLKNDFFSWQRIYDAHIDWELALASTGASNGKLSVVGTSSPLTVTLSSDKSSYIFDETAIIQGTVSEKIYVEKPTFQTAPVIVNISGPNFYHSVSLYPDLYLNYKTTLDLVQVLGISEGNYNVTVNYGEAIENISFYVGPEIIEIPDVLASSFKIQTDVDTYEIDELILISGHVSEIIPFESIKYEIIDPAGKIIESGNFITSDGNFQSEMFLPSIKLSYGTYTITAEYSDKTTFTTFNLMETTVDEETVLVSDKIIFDTKKTEYFLNDQLTISGYINNFDSSSIRYNEIIHFSFKDSDGSSPKFTTAAKDNTAGSKSMDYFLTAVPDNFGAFSLDARLMPVLFSEGDYTVKANYRGIINSISFSIIDESSSKNESPEKLFQQKTILEKVNRISDSTISILTTEKILDEQYVKPRVLSGSMITPQKNDQLNVNLQISSESGICIIGQNSDCLVSESTRKPGQIFEVVQVDGLDLNVRYSGPDVRLEKFSILPQSSDDFLPNVNWNIDILKDDEISRFYYKITFKTVE